MFCRLEMVLVRRFCEAPRFARVALIDARAASIAVIALSMLADRVAEVAPVRTTVPLPTDRDTASNLELSTRSMRLAEPVLAPTCSCMVPAVPSSRFLPFRLVEAEIRVISSDI
ncbi:hypothetical protein D3C78_1654780 [compost metagenome]